MRRTGFLIGGWTVATVVALMIGLLGVRAVSDSVSTPRPPSLSPASVKAALSSDSSSDSTESSSDAFESGPQSSQESQGGPGAQSGPGGASQSGSSAPSQSSSSSQSDDGSSSSAVPAPPEDRTYQLIGGSVGVRFENGQAHLLWATPNSGYTVDSSGSSSNVDVRFENDSHESRLKAFWNNGPQAEIEENPKN